MKIGIFDSGIGGLTVLKKLIETKPNNDYIYYGDTENLPYGDKTKEELLNLAKKDVEFLLSKKVDLIIIACGTVSSNCLEYLKNNYPIKIYDIISPTIKYLNESNYQNIGVIATNRTIDSNIFKNNLNKKVYQIKTPNFVPIIEENKRNDLLQNIDNYLSPYKDKIDILVLGCTHYPIIKKEISNYFQNNLKILDMSEPFIDKISEGNTSSINIYYSKLTEEVITNTKKIIQNKNINILKKDDH